MNEQKMKKDKNIVADDMLLTTDMPTAAGSKMLDGYQGLICSEAILRAEAAGYTLIGKADVGEFAIDLVGETSANGVQIYNGILKNASAEILLSGEAVGALCLDVNGYPRRVAAQAGLIGLKPTYGTVSRYGVVSAAPSGETVSILAKKVENCRELFNAVAEQSKAESAPIRRVAVLTSFDNSINNDVKQKINAAIPALQNAKIAVTCIENSIITSSKAAWNVILCAELCKNLSRYDGIRYGHRTESFSNLDELYTNSRTEGFGDLVKSAILWGSEVLSAENYTKFYDKSLRVRRVIVEEFAKLFKNFDAVLLPVCSTMQYTQEQLAADRHIAFEENRFTALASLTGLPTVVVGGVQVIGKAFSEHALLDVAEIIAGEGR